MKKNTAKVFLIGAGPGNPDLLTVKAKKILNEVDVVAYDSLISPALLMNVNPKAQLIHVGRRGYEKKLRPNLHPSVIKKAKEGKTVARLKSGDPMVFGKAFEECHELIKSQVPFEIIPGITSTLGAASTCAFPLTQKGASSELLFVNGQNLFKSEYFKDFEGTLVFYMGKKNLSKHCERLVQIGKDPNTPALYIEGATTIEQKVLRGNLVTLSNKVQKEAGSSPALFMVGEVLKKYPYLKENGDFFKPLSHARVLVLRSEEGSSPLTKSLKDLGAEIFEVPNITTHFYSTHATLLKEKKNHSVNLLFPTKESVKGFKNLLKEASLDIRSFFKDNWIALTPKAKEAIRELGIHEDAHPNKSLSSLIFTSQNEKTSHTNIPCYKIESHFPQFRPPQFDLIIAPNVDSIKLFKEGPWERLLHCTNVLATGQESYSFLKNEGHSKVYMAQENVVSEIMTLINSSPMRKAL